MEDSEAMTSQISDQVRGLPTVERQIGRTAWLKKKDGAAIQYPGLKKLEEVEMDAIDKNKKPFKAAGEGGTFHEKPLVGYKVVDFTNVLAGPNCGRMLCELGATVYKVRIASLCSALLRNDELQVEPQNPQHAPMVMVTWQAEGNAGKKTIIVDFKTEEGKKVAIDLIKQCDFALFNKNDEQVCDNSFLMHSLINLPQMQAHN